MRNKKEKSCPLTINISHGHCIYCGLILMPSEGFGDYTVEPSEIACSKEHLNKYRKQQNCKVTYDMSEIFNAKRVKKNKT